MVGGGEGATPVAQGGGLVRARSVELFVERRGRGASVVFLHGLADDHRLWRKVTPQLVDRYEVVVVDSPGHGQSGPIPDGVPLEWFADEVHGLVEAMRLDQPVVVGLSMGGGIAQYLASRHPGLLRGLVLVSTSPAHPEATRERFLSRADRAEREGMASILDITVPRWFTEPFRKSRKDVIDRVATMIRTTPPAGYAGCCHAISALDLTDRISAIKIPTIAIVGEDDPGTPVAAHKVIPEKIAGCRLEILKSAAHLSNMEQPAAFSSALTDFLARAA